MPCVRPVIALFAKAPVPGAVKTRLAPALGPTGAADLYQCFVRDALELLLRFQDRADVELHTDVLSDSWAEYGVTQQPQSQGDLGARMLYAIGKGLNAGRALAMIVGADSPGLPPPYIGALLESEADVTLGPTSDGGYYGIACRKIHRAMFAGIPWSTPAAAEATIRAARACGMSVALAPEYYDIDEPPDLALLARTPLPTHTAGWVVRNRTLLASAAPI